MTVSQAIARTDRLKPNGYGCPDKLMWLNSLDGRVKSELLDKYEDADSVFTPYSEKDETDRQLLVKEPYDELYIHYLSARIDYANGEYDRFNNSNAMFEAAYSAFRNAYNARHSHTQQRRSYF